MELFDSVPAHKVARDGGVEIAYWVVGEGEPLLLITGLATPAATWNVLPTLLADAGYRVIVLDNRDCGRSSPCDGLYSIADMAEDAVAVLDDAGVEETYLFGISMGGMIAQELVLNHPHRVRRLILTATNPGRPAAVSPSAELLTDMFTPRPSDSVQEATARFLGKLMGPGFADDNWDLILRMADIRIAHGSDAAAFSRQWTAIMGFAAWDRLDTIEAPTLVIHGREDPLVPFPNGEMIASRIPGAELIALDGVGHFVPLEAPAATVGAITTFFTVDPPAPRPEPRPTPRPEARLTGSSS